MRNDVGMSNIYLVIFKISMNVMVTMSVIMTVLTLLDLLCAHVMMGICCKMMEGLVWVGQLNSMTWCSYVCVHICVHCKCSGGHNTLM